MQNLNNVVYREEEREMTPLLQDLGVGMIPWSPLAAGFLTRNVKEGTQRGKTDLFSLTVNADRDQAAFLAEINERAYKPANKRGVSMARVALAWSLSKPFITAPIIGTASLEKLEDLVGLSPSLGAYIGCLIYTIRATAGVGLELTDEEINGIDEPYRPRAMVGFA